MERQSYFCVATLALLFLFFLSFSNSERNRRRLGFFDPSTTVVKKQARDELSQQQKQSCCYYSSHTDLEFSQEFTQEFVEQQYLQWSLPKRTKRAAYNYWREISVLAPSREYCEREWQKFVFEEFISMKHKFRIEEKSRYVSDEADRPRILLLGDSISSGVELEFYTLFKNVTPNIYVSLDNCRGFEYYFDNLQKWLGHCPWDVIQFNVGHHFHSKGEDYDTYSARYQAELTRVVQQLRSHTPDASIVFALTTPSPFDSKDTYPDRATCRHYNEYHKEGFVSKLNDLARQLAPALNITINDRYQVIQPVLGEYQKRCDIHYTAAGYQVLANNDMAVISKVLPKQSKIQMAGSLNV